LNVVISNTITSNILNLTTINDAFIGPVRVGRGANVVATDTVLGANVLLNDPGSFDTAIGYQAMKSAQPFVGYDTALGANTLQSDVGPGYNTAIGAATMVNSSPSSGQDVAVGFSALQNDVGAGYNTSIGTYSMQNSNPGGGNDTAVGYYALATDGGPGYNTAIGGQSMQGANPGGGYDTAVGWQTLQNDTGSYNTAIGANAGQGITGGQYNTALGAGSGPYSGSLSYTTAIGAGAQPTASNVAVFPALVNVGINTGAPRANLEVQGNVYVSNSVTVPNVFATNLNVGAVSNLTNLVVTSNILAGPSGNTYITGNVVVSGNVFSALGTPLGAGGSLYFSLGGTLTPSAFTGVLYGTTLALSLSTFSIQGTSTVVSRTANGYLQFSQTGVYNFRGVFSTTADNVTGVAIGSNVAEVHGTDQTYVYRHVPFISQNPTAVFDFDFYVGSTANYYYIDLFAVDSPTLQATSNALGGTWLTIGPSTGGGGSGGSITISTLGNCILNTSPGAADYYVGVNNGSTITLPLGASLSAGKQYIIKDESGLAGTFVGYRVTVAASGSDLIDGQASLIIALNYGAVNVIWTGTKWSIF
jgi:hypothetical protein